MRYSGKIGIATKVTLSPGVHDEEITERDYLGDILQRTERLEHGESVIPGYRTTTSVSVLSDGVLRERYSDIRYVTIAGVKWKANSVIHKPPRIEIYVGEEYHGKSA